MYKLIFTLLFVLSLGLASLQAQAEIKTYENRSEFLAETGGVDVIGDYPVTGFIEGSFTFQTGVENLTVTAQRFFTGEATSLLPGLELLISYGVDKKYSEDIDVGLAGNRYAFGFDFVEPSNVPNFVDSIFKVTLYNSVNTSVGSFTFNAPNDVAYFVGVWSDEAFNRVEIRETTGSNENEYYGHFYTGDIKAPTTFTVCPSGCDFTAIQDAANVAENGDIIGIAAGTFTEANISISKDLTLRGAGAGSTMIDGASAGRIFNFGSNSVTFDSLTITGGNTTGGGGAIGISTNAVLTVTNSVITGNTADVGGAIRNSGGSVVITNSTISSNFASSGGGAIYNSNGDLTITNSTISNNTTSDREGGGIDHNSGSVVITNSIISGNSAVLGGGGISNSNGPLTITNSTISGNTTSERDGGGIEFNASPHALTVSGSTISNNSAASDGGGIYLANGNMFITNSTISGNSADFGGGINTFAGAREGETGRIINSTITDNSANQSGGGIYFSRTSEVGNTIIAGNIATSNGPDCYGTANSLGFNLIGNTAGSLGFGTSDLLNVSPRLGPLSDNSGPTFTHALLPDSPAIDAIPVAACTDPESNPVTTDQRGVYRPQGSACDIGAYEKRVPKVNPGVLLLLLE